MAGWESGCKGVTVYRDGCRDGVLITAEVKKKDSFTTHDAPKRPKELMCDIHQATIQGEKWTIFIGKLEDKPYELFGGLSRYVNIPKKVKEGKILKFNGVANPIARYDLHYGDIDDETIIRDLTSVFENPTHGAFTRTLSLALRHGAPVQFIVEQLQKGDKGSDFYSFSKVISRVLKSYIANGTKASSKKCPSCSLESLVYKEGCISCESCGHSKCG
jgi:ribonucleoside-diphosphate reductase alpha chain